MPKNKAKTHKITCLPAAILRAGRSSRIPGIPVLRKICYNTRMEYTAEVNVLGVRAKVADTFARRARGLIGRPPPGPGEGLLIPRCNAIHTLFMKYPIDATFLDREDRVVKVVRGIRPWRLLVWGGWRAVKVLETASVAPRRTSGERPMVI